jgi:hypothetical protein
VAHPAEESDPKARKQPKTQWKKIAHKKHHAITYTSIPRPTKTDQRLICTTYSLVKSMDIF